MLRDQLKGRAGKQTNFTKPYTSLLVLADDFGEDMENGRIL